MYSSASEIHQQKIRSIPEISESGKQQDRLWMSKQSEEMCFEFRIILKVHVRVLGSLKDLIERTRLRRRRTALRGLNRIKRGKELLLAQKNDPKVHREFNTN